MRSDNKSLSNNAKIIPIRLFFADSVVPEIGVPDPEGILVPVVTEGFQELDRLTQSTEDNVGTN